jgi:C4-type Zn-finger protein
MKQITCEIHYIKCPNCKKHLSGLHELEDFLYTGNVFDCRYCLTELLIEEAGFDGTVTLTCEETEETK